MKALFDLIRRIKGAPLTQAEVDAVNASLRPDAPSEPEKNATPGRIGPDGLALIKSFEGLHRVRPDGRIEAYPDPGSGNLPITIGYGTTVIDGKPFPLGTVITREDAERYLADDLERYAEDVKAALGSALPATSQAQFDALVSFHYNTGGIARSTLTRKHKAGDCAGAEIEFHKWVNAGGKPMKGLIRRRAAEAALYRKGSA